MLEEFREESPQLVLMDISLPFFNGYHWCREIRRISRVPVMFLSSSSDNLDIVTAMNMGADDFISKPFDLSVLTAKVQALLRRTYEMGVPQDTRLRCGSGWLDMEDGTLQNGDCTITLTRGELKILRILLENRGRVVSREDLAVQLWQTDSFVDENTLSVAVTRLRRRMKEDFRLLRPSLAPGKYIFVARTAAVTADNAAMASEMRALLKKAGLINPTGGEE